MFEVGGGGEGLLEVVAGGAFAIGFGSDGMVEGPDVIEVVRDVSFGEGEAEDLGGTFGEFGDLFGAVVEEQERIGTEREFSGHLAKADGLGQPRKAMGGDVFTAQDHGRVGGEGLPDVIGVVFGRKR